MRLIWRWLVLAGLLCGVARAGETERLVSFRFDFALHRLCAEWAYGEYDQAGTFVVYRLSQQLCVDPRNKTVSDTLETRKFDGEDEGEREAKQLRAVLQLLAGYLQDTQDWWRDGRGGKISKPSAQAKR